MLDLGHVVAGPFAGTLLADLGAEVIKVEDPIRGGDTIRAMSPVRSGAPLWWKVAGRNKKSLGLDLRRPEGRQLLIRLLERADVLIENFRPGRLELWGLEPARLHDVNPGLIVLRISGFGQSSPWRDRAGFGRVGEAMSGAVNLTGEENGQPLHVGFSLGDATTGLLGAFGVLAALRERESSRRGDVIDLALYEALFRMIDWQIPFADILGTEIRRRGNRFPVGYAVGGTFLTADRKWLTVSAATEKSIATLLRIVGGDELAVDPRYCSFGSRSEGTHLDELNSHLKDWIGQVEACEVVEVLGASDVAVCEVFEPSSMLEEAVFHLRNSITSIADPDLGHIRMPGVVPTFARNPGRIRWSGARLGQHTTEILTGIGLDDQEIEQLRTSGVVA